MHGYVMIAALVLLVFVGPLLLALRGRVHARREAPSADVPRARWRWPLTVRSTLLYTLAFNVTFFIQELWLVLPKAFTPGLRPTLFHNNHRWQGDHPLASLFQGTGALATCVVAMICLGLLSRGAGRSANTRLFLIWMAYCGLFMALPQIALGALSPGSDLGMAMGYLELSSHTRVLAGLLALAILPWVALGLNRPLLALADHAEEIASPSARRRFVFLTATLPLLVGTALILPFRVPREWIEVVLVPVWVALLGAVWMQAGSWTARAVRASGVPAGSLVVPALSVLLLLLAFQCVLRPGIAFY